MGHVIHACFDCCFSPSFTSQAEEASSGVTKLQSALADDSSGQAASDSLSEEIAKLKAGVAAERVRFSHMTEALEATKGSVEEVSAHCPRLPWSKVHTIRTYSLNTCLDRDASLRLETPVTLSACVRQRAAKQQAQEEDRRVRLKRLRSENDEEVGKIRTEAAESLSKVEQAWETERIGLERELTEKVG